MIVRKKDLNNGRTQALKKVNVSYRNYDYGLFQNESILMAA